MTIGKTAALLTGQSLPPCALEESLDFLVPTQAHHRSPLVLHVDVRPRRKAVFLADLFPLANAVLADQLVEDDLLVFGPPLTRYAQGVDCCRWSPHTKTFAGLPPGEIRARAAAGHSLDEVCENRSLDHLTRNTKLKPY